MHLYGQFIWSQNILCTFIIRAPRFSRTFVVNGKRPVFREGLGLEIHSISSMIYWYFYDADTFAMRRVGSFLLATVYIRKFDYNVCHKHVFKHAMKTYMAEFNSDSFNQSG